MGWGALVGEVVGLLGGAYSQDKAGEQAQQAYSDALQYQQQAYGQQQAQLTPWRAYGASALDKLGSYYGISAPAQQYMQQDMMQQAQAQGSGYGTVKPLSEEEIRTFAMQVGGINDKGKVKEWARQAAPYGLDYYQWAASQGGVKGSGGLQGWAKNQAESELQAQADQAYNRQMGYTQQYNYSQNPQASQMQQAQQWAQANPDDPRSAQIMQMIGGQQ